MSSEKSASFMIRFTQKHYKDEAGEDTIQWRGKISHVQSGDDQNFTAFEKAADFMEKKLNEITKSSIGTEAAADQESILTKSFDILRRIRHEAPSFVRETIKNPIGQVGHLQDQIKEQIKDVSEDIGQKLDVDNIRTASRNDYKEMLTMMRNMADQINVIAQKVDLLEKKK